MVSKEEFKKEVWQIAEEIHAEPMQVRLCIMKNKVGSCSPNKVITFDISILNLDENFRREAIIHELLSLTLSDKFTPGTPDILLFPPGNVSSEYFFEHFSVISVS